MDKRAYMREYMAPLRLAWKRAGLCPNCGRDKPGSQYETCPVCRARSQENKRKNRHFPGSHHA